MSPIAKIPFTLIPLAGLLITYTSPTPPLQKGERKYGPNSALNPFILFTKTVIWTFTVAETAAILASVFPRVPMSGLVLDILLIDEHTVRNGVHLRPLSAFGIFLSTFGGIMRLECYRRLGKQFTFELSIREGHKLITDGPYAVVRHPSYTFGSMTIVGGLCYHGARGSWLRESNILDFQIARILIGVLAVLLLWPIVIVHSRIPTEDAELRRVFGDKWDKWAKEVPYTFIPGLY